MNELLLVVTIAGERVALPASSVESVVELDTLIPVPRAAPHVAGLSALRSRVLTVIDCMRSLDLGQSDCSGGIREAAVVEIAQVEPIVVAAVALHGTVTGKLVSWAVPGSFSFRPFP